MNIQDEVSKVIESTIEPLIKAYEELHGVPEMPTARVFVECIPHFEEELYALLQETFTVGKVIEPQELAPITPIFKDEFLGFEENAVGLKVPCYASDYWIAVDVPLYNLHEHKAWLQSCCSHIANSEHAMRVEYTYYPLREDLATLIGEG